MSIEDVLKHYEAALKAAFPNGASGDVFDHWNKARQAIATEESSEPVALQVVNGEICYKSTDDDQSFGMWCPINYDSNHNFPENTKFYTHPQPKIPPPPECQTEAEKTAYAFGWFKALESQRKREPLRVGLNDQGQLTFAIGVQHFTLDYFPEDDEDIEFMKRQLEHAIKSAHGIGDKA